MITTKNIELDEVELPHNWKASTLKEVSVYIQRGKSPKYTSQSLLPIVNQKCIRWEGIDRTFVKYIHPDQFEKWEEKRYLQNGDLLWNSTGTGTIGRAALTQLRESERLVVDSHVTIIRPAKGILPKYLHYWVMGPTIQSSIEDMQSGSTNQVELSKGAVENTPIPVAPPEQQKRIVAKIEKLFSHIDSGIVALNKSKQLLKLYRQSVLKSAVTGELTKQWRKENTDKLEPASELLEQILVERREKWESQQMAQFKAKGKIPKGDKWKNKYNEPCFPSVINPQKLPESWSFCGIDMLISADKSAMKTGPFGSLLKKHEHVKSGVPVLGIENIERMKFVPGSKIHITEEKAAELDGYKAETGDILISRSGTVGEVCVVPDNIGDARISTNLMKLSLLPNGMNPIFFTYLFNGSPFVLSQVSELCKGSTRDFLNQNILKQLLMVLPPSNEQIEILLAVEKRFLEIVRLEKNIDFQLIKAEKNKQSILTSAFKGKLVEEQESDGSVIELLEKIKNEQKHANTKQAKTRKPKKVNNKMNTRDLLSILRSKSSGITPNALMQEAGFTIEEVDIFYQELEKISGKINELKVDGSKVKNWPYDETIVLKLKD